MPTPINLASRRTAVARAARHVKSHPSDSEARSALTLVRIDLAEAKLAAYIERTVAEAPELTADSRARLAQLLTAAA